MREDTLNGSLASADLDKLANRRIIAAILRSVNGERSVSTSFLHLSGARALIA